MTDTPTVKSLKIIIPALLILLVTLFSFYPSLKNDFINLDDNLYVTDNSVIQAFTPVNLKNISTSFFITHYQPITIISYLIEYQFFKLDPWHYHLDNLILHLLNCLLVYWVIYLLTGRISIAALTALFFGIHPLQVESVAWISERKNVLYAFFYLGAIVSYLYYLKQKQAPKYYFLCLGLFILSLLSKSMAINLPLAFLSLDYFKSRKFNLALFTEKIPHFTLSLVFGLVALMGGYLTSASSDKTAYSLLTRLMGGSCDIVFYLSKLFLPVKLSAMYAFFEIKNNPFYYLCSFITVAILLIGVVASRKFSKKIIFGSGFFLLTIFPAIRFWPLQEVLTADRYVYLPCIGIFYLLAEGFCWLLRRRTRYYRLIRIFLVLVLVWVIILLSFSTWKRCRVWKDSLSLWNDVLENYPETASAYNNRGVFFLRNGEYAKAYADFLLAIKIKNKYFDNPTFKYNSTYKYYYLNLAGSLQALGRTQEAIAVYEQLIKEAETYFSWVNSIKLVGVVNKLALSNRKAIEAEAYINLANIKNSLGDNKQAVTLYVRAIELNPRLLYAYDNLGTLYSSLGKKAEAKAEFIRALEIDPTYYPAYVKLAAIYQASGQEEELKLLYKKAIAHNLDFFTAYYYLGNLSADARQEAKAISLYRRAIKINPNSKETCVGLGNAYLTIGKNKAAIIWLKKALELDPNLAVAHNNLALAYYYAQEYELAINHSDQASKIGYVTSSKLAEFLKLHRK